MDYKIFKEALLNLKNNDDSFEKSNNEIAYTTYKKDSSGNSIKGEIQLNGTNNIEIAKIFDKETILYLPENPLLKSFDLYVITFSKDKPTIKLYNNTKDSDIIISEMQDQKVYKINFIYVSPIIGWCINLFDNINSYSYKSDCFLWYNAADYPYIYKSSDSKVIIRDRCCKNDYIGNNGGTGGGYYNIGGMINYSPMEAMTYKYGELYNINCDVSIGTLLENNGIDLSEEFIGDEFTLMYYVWSPSDTLGSAYQRKSPTLSIGINNQTPQNCIMMKLGGSGNGFVKIYDGTTLAGTLNGFGSQEVVHISVTYSNIAKEAKVYKNGELKGTYTLTGENNIGNRLLIGGNFDQTSGMDAYAYGRTFFQDLKIYNSIKTQDEIVEEYNLLVNNNGVLN